MSALHAYTRRTAPDSAAPVRRPVQTKLRIGAANDPLEHEADRAADAVMRGESVGTLAAAPAEPQRMCAGCEAEEEEGASVHRKCAACGGEVASRSADTAARAVETGGAPLSREQRAYFEPRFGRDLSDVRIHADAGAASAAREIGARAYTLGSNIGFAAGEYAPASPAGRHLMAHELAHFVQQRDASPRTVRRNVAATSVCPANVHGARANPLDDLRAADAEAQRMALGASNILALEALTFRNPTFGESYVSRAYRRRFHNAGPATGPGSAGRFRDRFNGHTFASQPEAAQSEMLSLSARFKAQHDFLARNIRYRCPGTSLFSVGGCTSRCGIAFAWTCTPTDRRTIVICPSFWPPRLSLAQQAAVIVHESVHMRLDFVAENSATLRQRGRNPECYASLILDLYGEGVAASIAPQFTTVDPSCPP